MYRVDDDMLQGLDELESHPTLYQRRNMPVILTTSTDNGQNNSDDSPNEGAVQDSMGYSVQNFKDELLDLPLYEAYDSIGDPRHVFIPKNERNMTLEEIKKFLTESVLKQ